MIYEIQRRDTSEPRDAAPGIPVIITGLADYIWTAAGDGSEVGLGIGRVRDSVAWRAGQAVPVKALTLSVSGRAATSMPLKLLNAVATFLEHPLLLAGD